MKIKITKTYEISEIHRKAIAHANGSEHEVATHEECRDYLAQYGDYDLEDLVKSYYAAKAKYYEGLAK
jgi:hypothetical protein